MKERIFPSVFNEIFSHACVLKHNHISVTPVLTQNVEKVSEENTVFSEGKNRRLHLHGRMARKYDGALLFPSCRALVFYPYKK